MRTMLFIRNSLVFLGALLAGYLLSMGCDSVQRAVDALPPISFCHAVDLGNGKIEVCYRTKEGLHFSFIADKKPNE